MLDDCGGDFGTEAGNDVDNVRGDDFVDELDDTDCLETRPSSAIFVRAFASQRFTVRTNTDHSPVSGACSPGFKIIQFPAANAGASFPPQ